MDKGVRISTARFDRLWDAVKFAFFAKDYRRCSRILRIIGRYGRTNFEGFLAKDYARYVREVRAADGKEPPATRLDGRLVPDRRDRVQDDRGAGAAPGPGPISAAAWRDRGLSREDQDRDRDPQPLHRLARGGRAVPGDLTFRREPSGKPKRPDSTVVAAESPSCETLGVNVAVVADVLMRQTRVENDLNL